MQCRTDRLWAPRRPRRRSPCRARRRTAADRSDTRRRTHRSSRRCRAASRNPGATDRSLRTRRGKCARSPRRRRTRSRAPSRTSRRTTGNRRSGRGASRTRAETDRSRRNRARSAPPCTCPKRRKKRSCWEGRRGARMRRSCFCSSAGRHTAIRTRPNRCRRSSPRTSGAPRRGPRSAAPTAGRSRHNRTDPAA